MFLPPIFLSIRRNYDKKIGGKKIEAIALGEGTLVNLV
jgi:hypothetical protein